MLPEKTQKILDNIKDKSLTSKMTDLKTKIANMNRFKSHTILCDTSGSMSTYVGNENIAAIDVVQNTIDNFQGANIWEFNTPCMKVSNGKLGRPRGGTNMAGAFTTMKNEGIKELILLTDGAPDHEGTALEAAKGLKINIIYIGPQPTPLFLIQLAKVTGGQFHDVELIKLGSVGGKELENKIKGFLGA